VAFIGGIRLVGRPKFQDNLDTFSAPAGKALRFTRVVNTLSLLVGGGSPLVCENLRSLLYTTSLLLDLL
jgi:hypothetical protein